MKVCFWGDIAGALKGNTSGGSELQVALLARGLAKAGHEVVCVDNVITEDFITTEGIKVFSIEGWNKGIRAIRFFTHRLPKLYLILKKQKADIYYCRMRDFTHIFAYLAARKAKAKFILAMASDLDATGFKMRYKYFYSPNKWGGWWLFSGILTEIIHPLLLRKADRVLVQHEGQKQILIRKGIESTLFTNLIDITSIPYIPDPIHTDFIYVGWLDKRKGFAEFFELVQRAPSQTFKVIGPPRDKIGTFYFEKLKSYKNVSLLGELNHSDTLFNIANSKGLISTSPMEGFPNIFIEAWACGIPVLSLKVDPGGVIKREELGEVADGNLDRLLKALEATRNIDEFAIKAKSYVEHYHVLNKNKVEEISDLFKRILENVKSADCKNHI
jgi:glycosyltransferase involved in cell wall biosynthesis